MYMGGGNLGGHLRMLSTMRVMKLHRYYSLTLRLSVLMGGQQVKERCERPSSTGDFCPGGNQSMSRNRKGRPTLTP